MSSDRGVVGDRSGVAGPGRLHSFELCGIQIAKRDVCIHAREEERLLINDCSCTL